MSLFWQKDGRTKGVCLGGLLVGVDAIFFAFYWGITGGEYFELETRLLIAHVWNVIHAPINNVFGPLVFPFFRSHADDLSTFVGMLPYLILCFMQMFVIGMLIGEIVHIGSRGSGEEKNK